MDLLVPDDPAAHAALQRLLRLGAANIGSSGRDMAETERVLAELRGGSGLELAWFVYLAGALVATAAWKFAVTDTDPDPGPDATTQALRSIELALEAAIRGQDPEEPL